MELRVLNYFLMTAREENITKAAKLLHITQPTLSRQLMQLEEELGVTLFERGKHSITLTEDGRLLWRRAHLIMTRRIMLQNEIFHWFGAYAEEINIVAGGNLWYNLVAMVEGGVGVGLTLNLNCKYENVKFIPLSPEMESRTVLAWKKAQAFSSVTKVFISHARKEIREYV